MTVLGSTVISCFLSVWTKISNSTSKYLISKFIWTKFVICWISRKQISGEHTSVDGLIDTSISCQIASLVALCVCVPISISLIILVPSFWLTAFTKTKIGYRTWKAWRRDSSPHRRKSSSLLMKLIRIATWRWVFIASIYKFRLSPALWQKRPHDHSSHL